MCETMRDMSVKLQDGCQKSMQCMWILNINDAWKKFGQKLRIVISIGRAIGSIDWKFGEISFLKNKAF